MIYRGIQSESESSDMWWIMKLVVPIVFLFIEEEEEQKNPNTIEMIEQWRTKKNHNFLTVAFARLSILKKFMLSLYASHLPCSLKNIYDNIVMSKKWKKWSNKK